MLMITPVLHATHLDASRRGRLWRFLQFPVTRFLLAAAMVVAFEAVMGLGKQAFGISWRSAPGSVMALLIALGVLGVYAGYVRLIERRAVVELGRRGAALEFVSGWLLGTALFGVTMLILWSMGAWTVVGMNPWSALAYPLAGSLMQGCGEEILLRAILFRIVEESLGSRIALGLSAVIFGLLHAFNPGATAISSIAIALSGGILLGAAFMYTRRLWLAIGLHAAWNFTQGGIFGASVSGTEAQGLLAGRFHGSNLVTGGHFGPEASIVALLVALAAGAICIDQARRRGHVVRAFWQRPPI